MRVEWRASGRFERRGSGAAAPPTDMAAAFVGSIAPARSTGSFSGEEWGFAFHSRGDTAGGGSAQIGRTRNGVFL